jgi:hypothetical protein
MLIIDPPRGVDVSLGQLSQELCSMTISSNFSDLPRQANAIPSAMRETLANSLGVNGSPDTVEATAGGNPPAVIFGTGQRNGVEFSYAATASAIAVAYLQSSEPAGGVETVVVTGTRRSHTENFSWSDGGYEEGMTTGEEYFVWLLDQEIADQTEISITFAPGFTPNADQLADAQSLRTTINQINAALSNLPDNAILNIPGVGQVTAAEFKQNWSRLDIIIQSPGTSYANGSGRVEIDYNNRNPIWRVNADNLAGFAGHPGGLAYVLLHEIGHTVAVSLLDNQNANLDGTMTAAETQRHERLANDITLALSKALGIPILPDRPIAEGGPGYGYTPGFPEFTVPEPPAPPAPESPQSETEPPGGAPVLETLVEPTGIGLTGGQTRGGYHEDSGWTT